MGKALACTAMTKSRITSLLRAGFRPGHGQLLRPEPAYGGPASPAEFPVAATPTLSEPVAPEMSVGQPVEAGFDTEDRDLFSAYLGLHVRTRVDGVDRLDLQPAREGWLHRQDVDESPKSSRSALARKRRGRRHPPSRRSVARINARRKARAVMRQSRSAHTSTTDQPTAIAA